MSTDARVGRVPLDAIDFHQHNVRADLGDLRDLVASIKAFGVMQPVVLETRGDRLRLRAGHRRVAAARLAGLTRIPAVIHRDCLDDYEWLTAAVHENTRRRDLDDADRARTVAAMRGQGMTWDEIGAAFAVTASSARRYAEQDQGRSPAAELAEVRDAAWQERRDQIADMTARGMSAREIGEQLGMTARQVARYRVNRRGTQYASIPGTLLRHFAAEAQARADSGAWSAQDVVAAIRRLAETATLAGALAETTEAAA